MMCVTTVVECGGIGDMMNGATVVECCISGDMLRGAPPLGIVV